jgi:carbonic anhydrase
MIEELLQYNQAFVANKEYEHYAASKYPNKKIAILSCMDTRLTELLPAALGLKIGDVKMIRNAGGVISSPFGSVMRSLLIAVYNLDVEEILVIGHHDCGMQSLDRKALLAKMMARGVAKEHLLMMEYCGIDIGSWLQGFENVETSIRATVSTILAHPLMPEDVRVVGLVINPETGEINRV